MMKKVGMVGIGLMGHGIALNILKGGHEVVVFKHPGNQPLDTLRSLGARTASRLSELARGADVVILCVTGSPQVEEVLRAEDGILAGLKEGTIVIDCSTSMPASTEIVARAVKERGGRFLDAPMTRTPKEAAEGRLNLTVGGEAETFEAVKPLLECYAETIVYAGPVGMGHKMKLLHNFISLGFAAIVAEAAACARRSGVAPDVFVDVIGKGGGGGVVFDRLVPYLKHGDDSAFRFYLSNAAKDLGYYTQMAAGMGAAHVAANAILAVYEDAKANGTPDSTVPNLIELIQAAA